MEILLIFDGDEGFILIYGFLVKEVFLLGRGENGGSSGVRKIISVLENKEIKKKSEHYYKCHCHLDGATGR